MGCIAVNDKSYDPKKHHRRSIRVKGYDYSRAGAYFITICMHNHEPLFGRIVNANMELSIYGRIVFTRWRNLPRYYSYIELSAFTVMPNHIHGIVMIKSEVAGLTEQRSVSEIVRGFKTFSSRRINEVRGTPGLPVWQRNYWEHIIRDEDSFRRIHDYIITNPLRWHLDRENIYREGEDEFDLWLDRL